MTEKQLKDNLTKIHNECLTTKNIKVGLAKAVQLGMNYQEELIKAGMDAVFEELHRK